MQETPETFQGDWRDRGKEFQDLTLFTTTWYEGDETSKLRARFAQQFFERAHDLGLRCIVVDNGSQREFLDAIRRFDNVTLVIEQTLRGGSGRRQALAVALENPESHYFLWTEPEKIDLLTKENLSAMIDRLRQGTADIVVPHRKEETHTTMPRLQSWIERRGNKRAMSLVQKVAQPTTIEGEYDLWFGPKMFNRAVVSYFLSYQGEPDKWDAITTPVIQAANAGKRIASVAVDFQYRPEQQAHESTPPFLRKRIEQYRAILAASGDPYWIKRLQKKE